MVQEEEQTQHTPSPSRTHIVRAHTRTHAPQPPGAGSARVPQSGRTRPRLLELGAAPDCA